MDLKKLFATEGEQPFDHIPPSGGYAAIFRRIACIGDSLSSGEHETLSNGKKGFHDLFEYSWGQFIARDCGSTVYNFSKGGMTAHRYLESFAEEMGFWSEEKRAQAYIVALGVNDVTRIMEGAYELGTIADVHPDAPLQNAPTFAGWYGQILSRYRAIEPRCKLFLMTMPSHHVDDERGRLYDAHQALLHEIAASFGNAYVLDFRRFAPSYDDPDIRRRFYLGGHLNAVGYRLTALMVEAYIDYLVRHNPDDFREVGLIGTPYYND